MNGGSSDADVGHGSACFSELYVVFLYSTFYIWSHICVYRKGQADFYDHVSSIRALLLDSYWEADLLEEWIIRMSFWTWFLPHVDSHINVTLRLNCDNFSQLFLQSLKYNTVSGSTPTHRFNTVNNHFLGIKNNSKTLPWIKLWLISHDSYLLYTSDIIQFKISPHNMLSWLKGLKNIPNMVDVPRAHCKILEVKALNP